MKQKAKEQVFRPALEIVEEIVRDRVTATKSHLKPKQLLLKRAANRVRANMRPDEPSDLEFVVIFPAIYNVSHFLISLPLSATERLRFMIVAILTHLFFI